MTTIHNLPKLYAKVYKTDNNIANQIYIMGGEMQVIEQADRRYGLCDGKKFRLIGLNEQNENSSLVYRLSYDLSSDSEIVLDGGIWENIPVQTSMAEVLASLNGRFSYIKSEGEIKGLRAPQIGALHAVSATWTLEAKEPQTVVMPTGTGKTETMISLFAAHREVTNCCPL